MTAIIPPNTISVTVSGLSGMLVLENNGADDLTIIEDGSFTFAIAAANGAGYGVTVKTQPIGQTCVASNNTGAISGANVNISVVCTMDTYLVAGIVSGATGTVVLQNNLTDDVTVISNGTFTFATAIPYGSGYSVTVKTPSIGQTCTASNNAGTMSEADVTDVSVVCSTNSYTVGGTVTGLSGTLVLWNNYTDTLTIVSNGSFTFGTEIANGSGYDVSVKTQPSGLTCIVGSGKGVVSGGNVTNVSVVCKIPGSLDLGFGTGGEVTTAVGTSHAYANAVAIQPDGKIVAVGYSLNGSNTDFAVVRYNADGALDPDFDGDGIVTTPVGTGNDYAYGVAIQNDGKIVVAGYTQMSGNDYIAVVRYNTDGSLDTSFSDGDGIVKAYWPGVCVNRGYAVAIQPFDEKIVVAGSVGNCTGTDYDFAVLRFNTTGTIDTNFGGGITPIGSSFDHARAVAIRGYSIVVAGYSWNGTNYDFAVVRYNSDGSLDTSFSGDGKVTTPIGSNNDYATAVAIRSDGKIVAAGYSSNGTNDDLAIVRYNSNGSLDTTFGTGKSITGKVVTSLGDGNDRAYAVAIQKDGKIVAAGYSNNGVNNDFAVVRYNSGSSLDTNFDGDGKVTTPIGSSSDYATAFAIQSDGKIVAAGCSTNASNKSDFAIVRYWP